jgi:hypothetical protein
MSKSESLTAKAIAGAIGVDINGSRRNAAVRSGAKRTSK